ncbi:MAG: hypothetical protein IT258_02035 [Saprospiraceae bacterium]|nr:hypothetical protein [Saprospiraceae bacterium]
MLANLLASTFFGGAGGSGLDGEDMVSWVTVVCIIFIGAAIVIIIRVNIIRETI